MRQLDLRIRHVAPALLVAVLISGMFVDGTPFALAADDVVVKHDSYGGYFASNKFEPDAAQSFVVIHDQQRFDEVFGVAFVMRDKAHRLPKDAFADLMVLATVKRGGAIWEYQIKEVVEQQGRLEIRYAAKSKPQQGATFASPLIVSVPKKKYESVTFVENGQAAKTLTIGKN